MITMQTIAAVGLVYLIGINLAGFIIMGVDKKRAIRGAWRISEASLFFTALLGGSLGCILGMQHFRHKTKHWYSHRICYDAERSRRTGTTIRVDGTK